MASYDTKKPCNYGRRTIYISKSEKQLLSLSNDELKKVLEEYIPVIMSLHAENRDRTRYLWDYYLGIQDIKDKEKYVRPDINNKKVENWAYAIIDFKKAWQLGNPIQYVMRTDSSTEELERLNDYMIYENKEAKDQWLYEDILTVGRSFKYQNKRSDFSADEDGSPFEIITLDRDGVECIYSREIGHEQLMSIVFTDMEETILLDEEKQKRTYTQLTIYLRNKQLVCDVRQEGITWSNEIKPIILNEHIITESYLNRDRISLIEIGKDLFDGINQIESLDFDDLEQFVNALLVFTNAEVNEQDIEEINRLGAVNIKSTENRKASVTQLASRLNASDTQVFYTRLLTSLHQILGVPMATDNGTVTSGDTGKAKMTGQGYTSAGIRAKTDETMFKMCDKNSLKVLLKICKITDGSGIKELKLTQIEPKFNRDMSDNLLTKAQGLMNLLSAGVPKDYAVPIVNLFSDPTAVVKDMKKQELENQKLEVQNNNQEIQTQNNNLKKNEQIDLQSK